MANENDGNLRNNNNDINSIIKDENLTNTNSNKGDYRNIRAINNSDVSHVVEQQPRTVENPFSFKHFLNRDTNSATTIIGSATISNSSNNIYNNSNNSKNQKNSIHNNIPVTKATTGFNNISNNNDLNNQLNVVTIASAQITTNNTGNTINTISTNLLGTNIVTSATPYQTSTGARPKVPQSTSISSSISGVGQQQQYASTSVSTTSMSSLINTETTKMKRSPRFSSFDSQASLSEYSSNNSNISVDDPSKSCSNNSNLQKSSQQSTNSFVQCPIDNNYDKMYVPRSYSNYDMDLPIRNSSSFSGRSNCNENNASASPIMRRTTQAIRPNRLSGISSQQQQPSNINHHHTTNQSNPSHCRPNSEFAAALPDFVQDHWMEHPWYFNEMHLNSPPNSPNRQQSPSLDYVCEQLPAGMASPPDLNNCGMGSSEKCQTLPDFLSDGPIIHSSGRLADVAVGLPHLDSPEDNSPTLLLSRIRLENDRLRRELDESRIGLAEQTRRCGDLERLVEQARTNETSFNRTLAQNIGQVEENLDQSKKRAAAAQNLVSKLKQQVKQLTSEVEILKHENDSLRDEGAVGGSDRSTENIMKSSKTHQLSKDLINAATNAEINLRQLLLGVENLRSIAVSINKIDDSIVYNQNTPSSSGGDVAAASVGNENLSSVNLINEEFLSDCDDDFDDFSGPAL